MHTSVRQVALSGSQYFLRLDWTGPDLGSGFRLLLTDADSAWRGEVSASDLCEEAKELEMEKERYLQDLQQALSGSHSSAPYSSAPYSFSLSHSDGNAALTYDKLQNDISFRLGSVALTKLPDAAEAVRDLLVFSMKKGNSVERQNDRLEEQNQRLRREHQRITAQLEQYSKIKEDLESELYSRFVLVLNEKKSKIRSLQQTLQDLQKEKASGEQSEQPREDEYGGSTEEETEDPAAPEAASRSPAQGRTSPDPLDDGLADLTDVAPSRKRRFRHLEAPPSRPQNHKNRRSASPAATAQEHAPRRAADAAAATSDAEDLFEDF